MSTVTESLLLEFTKDCHHISHFQQYEFQALSGIGRVTLFDKDRDNCFPVGISDLILAVSTAK
jgi:hypothetical protein